MDHLKMIRLWKIHVERGETKDITMKKTAASWIIEKADMKKRNKIVF